MPITIQPAKLKYKNPQTSEYVPVAAVATYSGLIDDTAGNGDTNNVWSADKSYNTINSKLDAPVSAGASGQVLMANGNGGQSWQDIIDDTSTASNEAWSSQKTSTEIGAVDNQVIISAAQPQAASNKLWISNDNSTETLVPTYAELMAVADSKISDVRINNTSVVTAGVANIPIASNNTYGVVKVNWSDGIGLTAQNALTLNRATESDAKSASSAYKVCVAYWQHHYAFYGLAKAAGDSTQAASNNPSGTYTDEAKSAIQTMLGVPSATNPVIDGTISMGRSTSYGTGEYSIALGEDVAAVGPASIATGYQTYAAGGGAQAHGQNTQANGAGSYASGVFTVATYPTEFVIGRYNVNEGENITDWASGTHYNVGDKVRFSVYILQCIEENSDVAEQPAQNKWIEDKGNIFVIGGGGYLERKNILTVGSSGRVSTSDYVYVGANNDGSGGTRLPHDIQINGTSIVSNGVANIPKGDSYGNLGVVYADSDYGLQVNNNGRLNTSKATDTQIKAGTGNYKPLTPAVQHAAAFYGLAKAAGDTSQASSSNDVGQYTSDALVAIQKMLGTYEAPWELIRQDSFTNATAADYMISVDDSGDPFQLTDAMLVLYIPTQNNEAIVGSYGTEYFYQNGAELKRGYLLQNSSLTIPANSGAKCAHILIENYHGLLKTRFLQWSDHSNQKTWISVNSSETAIQRPLEVKLDAYVDSVKIGTFTGTMNYRLYGRRKWR